MAAAPANDQTLARVLALLGTALLFVLCWVLSRSEQGPTSAAMVETVEACTEPGREQPYRREALRERLLPGPSTRCVWQPLRLPMQREASEATFSVERRTLAVSWIRFVYTVPAQPAEGPLTLFMPRLSGEGWMLWVDGQRVADNLDDWRMTWNRPLNVSLPAALAPAGRQLHVVLGLNYGQSSGYSLSPLQIGPAAALQSAVDWRHALQTTMPKVCTAVQLLIGTFFFAFWCTRPSERGHLLLAAASVVWSVGNLQYVTARHDDPVLDRLYDSIIGLATAWLMWLIYVAVKEQFEGLRLRGVESSLPIYVLIAVLASAGAFALQLDISLALQLTNGAVAFIVTAVIAWLAVHGRAEVRLIAIALVVALVAGLHDLALISHLAPASGFYLLPASGILVTGAFLFAVQRRYARAIDEHQHLTGTLNQRLAMREAELTASHERLRTLEKARALAEERERLMGDIHDGLGSTLVATLAALERQRVSSADAAEAVRACIDDMRLLIDSLDPVGHDVGLLLANLRWRLGSRLQSSGVQTVWDLPDLQSVPWLDAPHSLQLLRLLQEAFANALKHSDAGHIGLVARDEAEALLLTIWDDGRGFTPGGHSPGRGLRTMRDRAQRLGGVLTVCSSPGEGTRLELRLPRQRSAVVESRDAAHSQSP